MTYGRKSGMIRREVSTKAASGVRQRGNTLVEQAFILVVLLTLLFAIIDFGRALYTYHFVSNAAREATRWASVRGALCQGLTGGCPADPSDVQTFVSNVSGMGLDPSKITTTTAWVAPPNNSPACVQNPKNPGCVVEVTVQYSYSFLFPFLPTTPLTMKSTSQMVISQ
jgi:Flp pilus assembly protein TadG